MKNVLTTAILMVFPVCAQQTLPSAIPSKAEFSELFTRAGAGVRAFDKALEAAKPALDKQDPDLFKKYASTARTARDVIEALQDTSPSAYGLVGLITTLGDVTLNASRAATVVLLVRGSKQDPTGTKNSNDVVAGLGEAQNGCYEVSELLTDATLKLIKVEEKVLMDRARQE